MKQMAFVFLLAITLVSCEKNISFDLKTEPSVLVVEASIENDLAPVVILTKSLGYFATVDSSFAESAFVHNAVINISNGVLTHQLKEYHYNPSPGIVFYYYSNDLSNPATAFLGALNTKYTLNIVSESKEYNASTSIPALNKKIDSMWWKKAPFQEDTTRIVVTIRAKDPPGLGNYIRYFTRKNSERFLAGENSVFDDQVIDGATYELQVLPGIDRNNRPLLKDNFFNRGDTISFKLSNIDKPTYTFWNTWEFAYQSIGNPFGQPNKVIGNISNGALGSFCGYGSSTTTIIVPK